MSEMIRADAYDGKSADIIMTDEYLIIKGRHYQLRDWYIRKSSENVSVPMKDILSVEYITMRSKRMLIAFLMFSCLLVFGGKLLYKAVTVTQSIDSEIDKAESVYNAVASDDVDISLTAAMLDGIFNFKFAAFGVFCMVLIAGSVISLLGYALRPYHFFRISAVGQMVAVERKYYVESDLQGLLSRWQAQL
jgi:hypothetical protein